MKRKVVLILLSLFIFPFLVEAKTCTVISGTGNDIGDEIACGSEHFYIIERNKNYTKMLAKYNLYVGDKIEKDSMTFNAEDYDNNANDAQYAAFLHCTDLEKIYGANNVETTGKYTEEFVATEYFCRIYTPLEYDEVKQSDEAIGLYPNGNKEIVYPIYGSVYLDEDGVENEFDDNNDMIPENSQFSEYLNEYKKTLTNLGVDVTDIGFIKKSGLESTINAVSDKKISIPTYNPDDKSIDPTDSMWEHESYLDYDLGISKFNIKEYVPDKYKWLYGTTYWIGSATLYKYEDWSTYYDEFLSTVGDYCSYSRGCHISKMGVGLRPVVTVNNDEIDIPVKYDYKFIKGDNQKLTIDNINEYTFTIDGDYSLFESLKIDNLDLIKDEDYIVSEGSTVITFTDKGISKLNSLSKGEYEILVKYSNDKEVKGKLTLNTITPPNTDIENPKTGDSISLYLFCGIISLIGLIGSSFYVKRKMN